MASVEDDAIALVGLAVILNKQKQKKKNAKNGTKIGSWNEKHTANYVNWLNEFESLDFKNYLQMDVDTYRKLGTFDDCAFN